ncbi:nucleotidyltransferase [Flavobacterium sp. LS1R47]|uniref:Nucleotidyltransferase n=1 Tax=Flavobacterium frigoritolerans TaxID=2987686 RepID=A0A9X3CAG7_9FLAO|nr:nucleotidyltransferase [Flavobacterium frigoritolerans]MCV9934556.1 nucleotidyltransferase [Flavobacterium frigoritolerans]
MARKQTEVKKEITTAFMSNAVLATKYGFELNADFEEVFSKVSIENIWFEIVAFSCWTLEVIYDFHKQEVDEKLANQKSGTLPWYRTMALKFQYGFDLVPDHDYFDNANATPDQIENSKIIKYAAVGESELESRVIIKIAGETENKLSPIAPAQKEAFEFSYMKEVKWAGVKITVINYKPDKLFLEMLIKRDALVLNDKGMSILNANYPVTDAILEYMKELPFDGELRLSALVDKIQKVPGVLDATIISAQSAWINPDNDDYDSPQPISIAKVPESGYFFIEDFSKITYYVV